MPKCLDALAGNKRRPALIKGSRDHHGHPAARFVEIPLDCKQARLEVERVDHRLGHQDIDARFHKRGHLSVIRVGHLLERDAAKAGVVDVRTDGGLLGGGADGTGNEPRPGRILFRVLVAGNARTAHGRRIDLGHQLQRQIKLFHADRARAEGVGFDNVGARLQVMAVDIDDVPGMRQTEDVGEILQIAIVVGKPLAPDGRLVQLQPLNLRAHRPVEQQNPLVEQGFQGFGLIIHIQSEHLAFFQRTLWEASPREITVAGVNL